jgi:serine/threonine-protein kinase
VEIGRFQQLEELARGGMGVVYKAHDPSASRSVALKVMLGSSYRDNLARKRFQREAQALGRVEHPGVVRVLGYDTASTGEPYMIMELVEGESLQLRLDRGGPLDPDDVVRHGVALCEAVQAAHDAGVLHRDLKPDNALVTRTGAVKLVDFGLVRDLDPSMSRTQLSVDGSFLGTPTFWSPEQARGDRDLIDARTDVYGLGATMFALLTGEPPHGDGPLPEVMRAVQQPKPRPSSLNPAVPAWLDRVVARAMEIDPNRRYPSAAALGAALAAGGGQPTGEGPSQGAVVASLGLVAAALVVALLLVVADGPQGPAAASPQDTAAPARPESEPLGKSEGAPRPGLEPTPSVSQEQALAAEAAVARGSERLLARDVFGAMGAFTDAIRLDPGSAVAYEKRAYLRLKQADWQGALEDAEAALRLGVDDANIYRVRGSARMSLDDRQRAIEDFDRAIVRAPDDPAGYYARGVARVTVEDFEGAVEDLERAADMAPHQGVIREHLDMARDRLARQRAASPP